MTGNSEKYKLGVFVTVAIILLIAGLIAVAGAAWRRETLPAYSRFRESVQGLEVGSPVKFRGVTIGTVKAIVIEPNELGIRVDMELHYSTMNFTKRQDLIQFLAQQLQRGASCRLQLTGLTGMRYIEIDFYRTAEVQSPPPGGTTTDIPLYIPAVPSLIAGITNDFHVAVMKISQIDFAQISERLAQLLLTLNDTLNQEHLRNLMRHLEQSSGQLATLMQRIDEQLQDRQLEQTVKQLNHTLKSIDALARRTEEQVGTLDLPRLQDKLAAVLTEYQALPGETKQLIIKSEQALEDIRRFSETLRSAAEKLDLDKLGQTADSTMTEVRETLQTVQNLENDVVTVLRNLNRAAASFAEAGEVIRRDPAALLQGSRRQPVSMGKE